MAERAGLFSPEDIRKILGCDSFHVPAFPAGEVTSVVIDSREAVPGCLFVPLKGDRTDGHLYVREAFEKGCRFSFVDRAFWEKNAETLKGYAVQYRSVFLIVDSSLRALQELAAWFLRDKKAFRVGVTGSNGKTTTKEIVGSILAREGSAFVNRGNLNSEIGLPLSVFEVRGDHRFAVFEMGMNRRGEMDLLADIVRPRCGVITNVGTAHIGILGSIEAIAEEKRKVFDYLEPGDNGYVYEGDEFFDFLKAKTRGTISAFGERTTPGFEGFEDRGLEGYLLRWKGRGVRLPLPGIHNLRNALAGISLCLGLGVSDGSIRDGIEAVEPLFGRGQIFRGEITVLQDCYNANPDSMGAAVDFLKTVSWKGRKLAVLASMKELGDSSAAAHRDLGVLLAQAGFDGVFLFGEETTEAITALRAASKTSHAFQSADFDVLRKELTAFLKPGDLVLVKGSRSMALERVTEAIRTGSV